MTNWMAALAAHHARMRQQYPDDALLLLFDIDGTILDLRHMIFYLLTRYDREHGADHFRNLSLTDIDVHENVIDRFLQRLGLAEEARLEIEEWYRQRYWSPEIIATAHYAFENVFAVIRWFQMQPNTTVGLNTGREEHMRADTLAALNRMGEAHGVHFTNELLYMRPNDWTEGVAACKVLGVEHVRAMGYRVIAFLDNEPGNLAAIAQAPNADDILLLHADTIFLSPLDVLPPAAIQGIDYSLVDLITEEQLPPQVALVWHGVNDPLNLRQFLASPIRWAELDVNVDPTGAELILRHDTFAERALVDGERWLTLDAALAACTQAQKAVKLDFKVGGAGLARSLALVDRYGLSPDQLWFNGEVQILAEPVVRKLAARYPGAVIQAPIGSLRHLLDQPAALQAEVQRLADWGMNRFSLNWQQSETRRMARLLREWGYEVNLYGIPDLPAFLQALLLLPNAITCDFNFPEWGYYGRGSGHAGHYIEYLMCK
ncbi:MAG: hypothetical protein DYG89_44605 [Caldilinea sp. CFX5]|nr:hypothetical protein [Caldilinea sp. CFX5]